MTDWKDRFIRNFYPFIIEGKGKDIEAFIQRVRDEGREESMIKTTEDIDSLMKDGGDNWLISKEDYRNYLLSRLK